MHTPRNRPWGRLAVLLCAIIALGLLIPALASTTAAQGATHHAGRSIATKPVTYRGYRIGVPNSWTVVDLRTRVHACVRFDHPAVYLGLPGDQRACPAHLIGGAPGLLVEPLADSSAQKLLSPAVTPTPGGSVLSSSLPRHGPLSITVEEAGLLVTAVYGDASRPTMSRVLHQASVLASARPGRTRPSVAASNASDVGVSVPGTYAGPGFDACTAPSPDAMNAWYASSPYRSVGVYIGGVSRGCAQPNLTSAWVTAQVAQGWHVIPTYVGAQAPCTGFYNRMSYDPATARARGRAEAGDAVVQATALGIAAPSTIYADIEGYDSRNSACVAAVLSYVSGWTRGLHAQGYVAGVYSSAGSGIRDLANAASSSYNRPDDIWFAWWNYAPDVSGGSYFPLSVWSEHQRVHQYAGDASFTYGGYTIAIDRNTLDVSSSVAPPVGCPANLSFGNYPTLRLGDAGKRVLAAQCRLAHRGFDPGAATGTLGWRTAAAIDAFSLSRGLETGRVLGRRPWTALLSAGLTRVLHVGSTGPAVRKLQRALTASLQRTVTIDGTFGRATRRAVLDYQHAHALAATGRAERETWHALKSGR
ncbi:MAG: glycoside hydrolase domain-containing protein [Nocardioidaceae bacterium]